MRIKVKSNDGKSTRMCDVRYDEVLRKWFIETKHPGQNPIELSLEEFARQVNDAAGQNIISINYWAMNRWF